MTIAHPEHDVHAVDATLYLAAAAVKLLRAGTPIAETHLSPANLGAYYTLIRDWHAAAVTARREVKGLAKVREAMDAYWTALVAEGAVPQPLIEAVQERDLWDAASDDEREPRTADSTAASSPRPIIIDAEAVQEQPIRWLWYPYIPRGMLVLLDGDPGLGKSMMLVQIAANLSRGLPFLDQLGKPTLMADVDGPQSTLVLSAEDSLEHVMIPRLKRAGADLTRIRFLQGWLGAEDEEHAFELRHLDILRQAMTQVKPALVILDPLVAYLGEIDMHRANETRPLMAALKRIAEQHHCTIVGVRHPAKTDQGGRLMYRGQGNIDIIGAARSALWVQPHPVHPETHSLLIHSKTNVGMPGRTVIFSRERGEFRWVGVSRLTEAMVTGKGPDPYALLEAFFWLEETMTPGVPYRSSELEKEATDRDISLKILKRAKKLLGIQPKQVSDGWLSILPPLSTHTTTRTTGYTGTTGATGTTGYSDLKSNTYVPETQCNPVYPVDPEYPVDPVIIRARENECCPRCGHRDWDIDAQGQRLCIPCAEREAT